MIKRRLEFPAMSCQHGLLPCIDGNIDQSDCYRSLSLFDLQIQKNYLQKHLTLVDVVSTLPYHLSETN